MTEEIWFDSTQGKGASPRKFGSIPRRVRRLLLLNVKPVSGFTLSLLFKAFQLHFPQW